MLGDKAASVGGLFHFKPRVIDPSPASAFPNAGSSVNTRACFDSNLALHLPEHLFHVGQPERPVLPPSIFV
jgi:hypothetical protein